MDLFQHQNLIFWNPGLLRVILTHPLSLFFSGLLLSLLVVSSCLPKRGPVIMSLQGCFLLLGKQLFNVAGKTVSLREVIISILFFFHEMTTYTSKISTYTSFFPRTLHVHTVHKKKQLIREYPAFLILRCVRCVRVCTWLFRW